MRRYLLGTDAIPRKSALIVEVDFSQQDPLTAHLMTAPIVVPSGAFCGMTTVVEWLVPGVRFLLLYGADPLTANGKLVETSADIVYFFEWHPSENFQEYIARDVSRVQPMGNLATEWNADEVEQRLLIGSG